MLVAAFGVTILGTFPTFFAFFNASQVIKRIASINGICDAPKMLGDGKRWLIDTGEGSNTVQFYNTFFHYSLLAIRLRFMKNLTYFSLNEKSTTTLKVKRLKCFVWYTSISEVAWCKQTVWIF